MNNPIIKIKPDCGNSPRKGFLKDFNIALATGDIDYFDKVIQDKIEWEITGQIEISEKKDYLKQLNKHCLWNVKSLTIETIITHGPDACVYGTVTSSENKTFRFCDIYRFKGARGSIISRITSFIIEL